MSLQEVVNEIADEMEQESIKIVDVTHAATLSLIKSWAKQLRRAVKAVGDVPSFKYEKPDWAREAQEEFKKKKKELDVSDIIEEMSYQASSGGNTAIEVIGGPMGGTEKDPIYIPTGPGGKPGMKIGLGGAAYRLGKDGKLHYDEEETKVLQSALKKKIVVSGEE